MSVYMIISSKVLGSDKYGQHIDQVSPLVEKYGGRYHVRGENIKSFGSGKPDRVIVIEFPSEANIKQWLASSEYRAIAPLREAGAETQAIIVEIGLWTNAFIVIVLI